MSQRPDQLPVSYWHATFPPPVPEESLPAGTDVAVIGGGMLGVWTAYWLARQGVDVTLIEREVISWGATGRNGGFLTGLYVFFVPVLGFLIFRNRPHPIIFVCVPLALVGIYYLNGGGLDSFHQGDGLVQEVSRLFQNPIQL